MPEEDQRKGRSALTAAIDDLISVRIEEWDARIGEAEPDVRRAIRERIAEYLEALERAVIAQGGTRNA